MAYIHDNPSASRAGALLDPQRHTHGGNQVGGCGFGSHNSYLNSPPAPSISPRHHPVSPRHRWRPDACQRTTSSFVMRSHDDPFCLPGKCLQFKQPIASIPRASRTMLVMCFSLSIIPRLPHREAVGTGSAAKVTRLPRQRAERELSRLFAHTHVPFARLALAGLDPQMDPDRSDLSPGHHARCLAGQ